MKKQFVGLKKGFLLIEESQDPSYPGVYVSYVENVEDVGQTLCLIEDDTNSKTNEAVAVHIWGDCSVDNPTETTTIRKANWNDLCE